MTLTSSDGVALCDSLRACAVTSIIRTRRVASPASWCEAICPAQVITIEAEGRGATMARGGPPCFDIRHDEMHHAASAKAAPVDSIVLGPNVRVRAADTRGALLLDKRTSARERWTAGEREIKHISLTHPIASRLALPLSSRGLSSRQHVLHSHRKRANGKERGRNDEGKVRFPSMWREHETAAAYVQIYVKSSALSRDLAISVRRMTEAEVDEFMDDALAELEAASMQKKALAAASLAR